MSDALPAPTRPKLRKAVQGVLVFLAIYHLATGILCVCFPEYSRAIYARVYDFNPTYWDQYRLILKPWGSYALFTGAVLFVAAWDPERYRGVIWFMACLLLIRCTYRVVFAGDAEAIFKMDRGRNYFNVALMLGYNCVLIPWSVLQWREEKGDSAARLVDSPA